MCKETALRHATQWLLCATSKVSRNYFQLPVAGKEDLEYRERVYCYELYHQWRKHWPKGFEYSLSGEVDKGRHPLIRKTGLDRTKPDFLVHEPGQMNNLLVVEVKSGNATTQQITNDLVKLTQFLAPNLAEGYRAAYFLIYGMSRDGWKTKSAEILRTANAQDAVIFQQVKCLIHEKSGKRAVVAPWG